MGVSRRDRVVAAGYSAAVALLVAGPLLRPGYLLLRDAVSTPRSYPTDSALGLGDAAPRAVPQDALLAVLSPIMDGGLIVKAILVVALWAAAYGGSVLARELLRAPLGAQLVAATVALWNPFVAERLLQGHWSLLTGYAALPWTVLAAYRLRYAAAARKRMGTWADTAEPPEHAGPTSTAQPVDTLESPAGTSTPAGPGHPHSARAADTTGRLRSTASTHGAEQRRGLRQIASAHSRATGAWAALAVALAAAGLTPTGALLAGCTAIALVRVRQLPATVALWVAASAPWLTATALSGAGSEPSDPAGIASFAARAEPGLGTLGSVAGLGGIWNSEAVPDSRTTPLAAIGTVALLVIVALGLRAVAKGDDDPDSRHVRRMLLLLAAVAVLFPTLGATPWGMHALEWLVAHVPGAGLLRDTQKYVALAMPAYALCAAAGCGVLAGCFSATQPAAADQPVPAHRAVTSTIAAVFVALLVLPLYDLAWGVGAAVRAVRYPDGWQRVAERVDDSTDIAVLPGGMFRKFPYSGAAPVLDPAPRMLPGDVLQTGELPVHGRTVSGEGARAGQVEALLLHGDPAVDLARLGVGWVLVERTTPGPLGESAATLAQLEPTYADADLALYRVPGVIERRESTTQQRAFAYAAHSLWGAILIAGPLVVIGMRARSRAKIRR
ncbi:hypothetical protein AB0M45_00600 [Nocardia sp. NPDC051787]|uniref:hypothetical protein n=1 Tax=Nocardia sp. NPDC051787 TaxID=3155415 RepID=UPI003413C758